MNRSQIICLSASLGLTLFTACGKSQGSGPPEDTSASGNLGGVIGGTYNTAVAGGTLSQLEKAASHGFDFFPEAWAVTAKCPTPFNTQSGCTYNNYSGAFTLSYANCEFQSSIWGGTQTLTITGTNTSIYTCGSFSTSGLSTMTRTFSGATRTSPAGTLEQIKSTGSIEINYSNGTPSGMTFTNFEVSSSAFDNIVNGTLTFSSASSISGTLTVQNVLARVTGTAQLNSIGMQTSCCVPTRGSITTSFSNAAYGGSPNSVTPTYDGKSETMTFSNCGTGSLQSAQGTLATVALNNCF